VHEHPKVPVEDRRFDVRRGENDLRALARSIRLHVLEQSKRAHVGHIGSALSITDLVAAMYGGVLRGEGPDRDRFILSKGHAVLAVYAALVETGRIDPGRLAEYCGDASDLGGHPEHSLEGIDFSTGSLGHGLSIGCGAALGARLSGSGRRTFVLMSDAECNEGSVWEAAMFAAHHQLDSLTAVVDLNGQQALGYTRDVLDLDPLAERWGTFGWAVHDLDGHDPDACAALLEDVAGHGGRPHVVIARTTFGAGVSFMESRIEWHYLPMSDEQFSRAREEVATAPGETG
jgi:transketolase